MTDKKAIQHLHSLLQHRNKWYIDPFAPDIPVLQEVVEKAKEAADYSLGRLSASALYSRYERWRKSDPFIGKDEDLFHAFLNQVVFDLGLASMRKEEKLYFEDSCNLKICFI